MVTRVFVAMGGALLTHAAALAQTASEDEAWALVNAYWSQVTSIDADFDTTYQMPRSLPPRFEWGHVTWKTDDSGGRYVLYASTGVLGVELPAFTLSGWLGTLHWGAYHKPQLDGTYEVTGSRWAGPPGWRRAPAGSLPLHFHMAVPPLLSWHEVLRERGRYRAVRLPDTPHGLVCVRVEPADAPLWTADLMLDTQRGLLPVTLLQRWAPQPDRVTTVEVTEARETAPGLWYPTQIHETTTGRWISMQARADGTEKAAPEGDQVYQWHTFFALRNVQVNGAFADSVFEADFLPGARIYDEVDSTQYVVPDPATGLPPDASARAGVAPLDPQQSAVLAAHLDAAARAALEYRLPAEPSANTAGQTADDHPPQPVAAPVGWSVLGAAIAAGPVVPIALFSRHRRRQPR
jgi:hypothetical protein